MRIWEDLYYIVYHKDLTQIKILHKAFDTLLEAKQGLEEYKPKNKKYYSIMTGEKIFQYNLENCKTFRPKMYFTKYKYPEDRKDKNSKRVFRTTQRRKRKRRIKYQKMRRNGLC